MEKFTVLCVDRNDPRGTTWIDTVEASNIEEAKGQAISKCAWDWDFDILNIRVLGVLQGNPDTTINVLFWEDACEVDDA